MFNRNKELYDSREVMQIIFPRNKNHRESRSVSWPLRVKQAASNTTFSQSEQRKKTYWNKQHFGMRYRSRLGLPTPFYTTMNTVEPR